MSNVTSAEHHFFVHTEVVDVWLQFQTTHPFWFIIPFPFFSTNMETCPSFMSGSECELTFIQSLRSYYEILAVVCLVFNLVVLVGGSGVVIVYEKDIRKLQLNSRLLIKLFYIVGAAGKWIGSATLHIILNYYFLFFPFLLSPFPFFLSQDYLLGQYSFLCKQKYIQQSRTVLLIFSSPFWSHQCYFSFMDNVLHFMVRIFYTHTHLSISHCLQNFLIW